VTIADGPSVERVRVAPTADAHVGDGAAAFANNGSAAELQVGRPPGTGGVREAYLSFDISQFTSIGEARLALFPRQVGTVVSGTEFPGLSIFGAPEAVWDEASLTWHNRPGADVHIAGGWPSSEGPPEYYAPDVTSFIRRQRALGATSVTLVLRSQSNSWVTFDSREGTSPPALVVLPQSQPGRHILYTSHQFLSVGEGASDGISTWTRLGEQSPTYRDQINVLKIPGGDPDINATVGAIDIGTRSPSPPPPTPTARTAPRRSSSPSPALPATSRSSPCASPTWASSGAAPAGSISRPRPTSTSATAPGPARPTAATTCWP
jgi:hypothetical protein